MKHNKAMVHIDLMSQYQEKLQDKQDRDQYRAMYKLFDKLD